MSPTGPAIALCVAVIKRPELEDHELLYHGGKTIVAAEVIEILRIEAQSRGLTLEEMWSELVGQEAARTCQHLARN